MLKQRFVLAFGLLTLGVGIALAGEQTPAPDILLIMPDQMRGDCLSILGHPAVRTPSFDQLARQGVLFRRAYTAVPSCIPARYAMLTGLHPQTSGVVGYKQKPIDCPTMPQVLGQAGYRTALVGRNMHQIAGAAALGYHASTVSNEDYVTVLKQAVPGMTNMRKWVNSLGLTYNHWQAKPWPLANELHPTAWVVQQARRVLAEASPDQPLFLTASFVAPHPPLFPPERFFEAYRQQPLPAPAHGDWVNWSALTTEGDRAGHRVLLQGETLRRAQAGYFGLIEHLDSEVATLIAEFQARSVRAGRPWVIVLTADHGEMLGDHGFFRKCEPFEGSANIPFIICGSAQLRFKPARRCLQPVCLEDLLPTFAELAGAPCPQVDGVSLVSELRGKQTRIRPWLHFEHAPCYSKQQAFHALTDGHAKYIWRPQDGTEHLFDLDQDPQELHDLAADTAQRTLLSQWRHRLVRRLAGRPEGFSDGEHLIAGRPYPPLQAKPPRPAPVKHAGN